MTKNILFVLSIALLSGCQNTNQTTGNIENQNSQKFSVEILRYQVSNDNPVFSSGRTYGHLAIEDNCLVIKRPDATLALALPISDDNNQWQTYWDDINQELVFDSQRYQLGSHLDLGGGGMGHEQIISNSSACHKYNVFGAFSLTVE